MTVIEYVKSKPVQGINKWLKCIAADGYTEYENLIIACADDLGKIEVNHNANFKDTIEL